MADPVAHFQAEVDKLNKERTADKELKISSVSPVKYLGYFPLRSIMNKLKIKNFIDLFKMTTHFEFDLYDALASLVFARSVNPCSKFRTFHEVIPCLYEKHDFSYDQLMAGLGFFGRNYEKIVELFTSQVNSYYGLDTNNAYFDCTNFFFEIDKEDEFRKKGPSKENRKDPIIGLGLLLDANQIPIGMKMYPGNESEKPVLRDVIDSLKKQNNISGKTIHVADKGLNCADNIAHSILKGDGYLFSKSVKSLPDKEKVWVLSENGWQEQKDRDGKVLFFYKSCIDEFTYAVTDKDGKKKVELQEKRLLTYNPTLAKKKRYEINKMVEKAKNLTLSQAKRSDFGESGKYVNFESVDEDGKKTNKKATVSLNNQAIEKDLTFAGYNLLVTSEIYMKDIDIYDTYHNLWRIEESFKIMKSDLDARPVFAQTEDSIKGHFLICYITVLLERIFQFKILKNKYSTSEIFKFIKNFQLVKVENKYTNISTSTSFIEELAEETKLPITNLFLSETQIKKVLNHDF